MKLLNSIEGKKENLLNYYFLYCTNFDFLGDSIVEAANTSIKTGPYKVNNSMSIHTSSYQQVQGTQAIAKRKSCEKSANINKKKIWTRTKTAVVLTDFAEGLCCANFDRTKEYYKRQKKHNEWFIMHKSCMEIDNTISTDKCFKPSKFKRVRVVSLDNNFMTCSCGYPQRFLMPCVHIFTVLDKPEYLVPSLFHIRWWKHFNFLHKNKDYEVMNQELCRSLSSTLKDVRKKHYDSSNGYRYKGIPMEKEILNRFSTETLQIIEDKPSSNKIFLEMIGILNMKIQNKPASMGKKVHGRYYQEYTNDYEDNNDGSNQSPIEFISPDEDDLEIIYNDEQPSNLGVGSQTLSQLSATRQEIQQNEPGSLKLHNSKYNNESSYNTLLPIFNQLVNNIRNRDHLEYAKNKLESLSFDILAMGAKSSDICDNQTTMLGQCFNGSRRIEKRKRAPHER